MTSGFTFSLFAANNCLLMLGTRLVIDETQPNSKDMGKKTKTVSIKELKYNKLISAIEMKGTADTVHILRYVMPIFLSLLVLELGNKKI